MARCEIDFPQEVYERLLKFTAESAEILTKALNSGTNIVVDGLKSELKLHSRAGDLVKSIKATKAKEFSSGKGAYYTVVRPTGDSKKMKASNGKMYARKVPYRNMEKMAALEYGVKGRQSAQPCMKRVMNACKPAVEKKMDEIIKQALGDLE